MPNIQLLFHRYTQHVLEKNIEGFLSLYDLDVVVFDAFDRWRYDGNHQWREVPTLWFTDLQNDVVDVVFREVRVEGNDELCFAYGLIDYRHQSDQSKQLANRFTWIVKRIDGEWKIIHEHTSLPVNSQTDYFIRESK